MSTTFGIIIKDGDELLDLPQTEDVLNIEESDNIDIVEVYFRGNFGGGYWMSKLAQFLPNDTKVYALDNTAQGIYTIGDLLKEE